MMFFWYSFVCVAKFTNKISTNGHILYRKYAVMCITFRIYILIGRFVLLINALGLDFYSG